ncbi:hypothetical protein CF15_04600 [Pyrodictium occultum]|uniref:Adenosylcobinamide-GDP ribazoletransferase n=1 Tax=Pyrodictium occultum TaxID=2309 RepID=A0A0V8RVI5_PYROC|nr:adenosylcobinamide-GDP ribazoletransferase [Pyrodictium occultum]KSW12063.1 hypothetical protein CF15_04600 [Pyrodictium occultum]
MSSYARSRGRSRGARPPGAARRLACLASFLTRLPLGCHDIEEAARGYPLVPLVGLVEGVLVYAAMLASRLPGVAAALGLAAHVLVTGALHLDGFADYSDAAGAGARGDRALEVMKDPRRGGFALAYTATLLLAKYAGFMAAWRRWPVVLASYLAAAEAMYMVSLLLPAPGYEGLGSLFRRLGTGGGAATVNMAVYALAALALLLQDPLGASAALAGGVAAALVAARDARGRLGYASGDVLGFAYELAHTSALLAAALLAG